MQLLSNVLRGLEVSSPMGPAASRLLHQQQLPFASNLPSRVSAYHGLSLPGLTFPKVFAPTTVSGLLTFPSNLSRRKLGSASYLLGEV